MYHPTPILVEVTSRSDSVPYYTATLRSHTHVVLAVDPPIDLSLVRPSSDTSTLALLQEHDDEEAKKAHLTTLDASHGNTSTGFRPDIVSYLARDSWKPIRYAQTYFTAEVLEEGTNHVIADGVSLRSLKQAVPSHARLVFQLQFHVVSADYTRPFHLRIRLTHPNPEIMHPLRLGPFCVTPRPLAAHSRCPLVPRALSASRSAVRAPTYTEAPHNQRQHTLEHEGMMNALKLQVATLQRRVEMLQHHVEALTTTVDDFAMYAPDPTPLSVTYPMGVSATSPCNLIWDRYS